MLLAYTTLQYYGPGAAAMVAQAPVVESAIQPVMAKRFGLLSGGVGTAAVLRCYRGRAFSLHVTDAQGRMTSQPRKQSRFALSVAIGGALTQDDVTGAVLDAKVNATSTMKQAVNALLTYTTNNPAAGGGTYPPAYAVMAGAVYGPSGADYVGTLATPSAADVAQSVADLLAISVLPVNLVQVKGQALAGTGSEADPWGP